MGFGLRRGIISSGVLGDSTYAASMANLNGTSQDFNAGNPTALKITGNLTLNSWVKPSGNNAFYTIMGKYDGAGSQSSYKLHLITSSRIQGLISTDGSATQSHLTSSGQFSANELFMVSMVYDGSTIEIFKNGVSLGSTSATGTIFDGTADVIMGAEVTSNRLSGGQGFPYIWSKAVAEADLLSLYNLGTAICYDDLEANISGITTDLEYAPRFCNWDTNAGDELVDQSSNGITTTNTGSTPFTATGLDVLCT